MALFLALIRFPEKLSVFFRRLDDGHGATIVLLLMELLAFSLTLLLIVTLALLRPL